MLPSMNKGEQHKLKKRSTVASWLVHSGTVLCLWVLANLMLGGSQGWDGLASQPGPKT